MLSKAGSISCFKRYDPRFNRFHDQGLHLFLDPPLICLYNSSKDRVRHKNGRSEHIDCKRIGMRLVFRLLAMLVVVPATYYFVYWVPFSFAPFLEQRWIPSIISLLCAIGVGWYVWKRLGSTSGEWISSTLSGAIVLGAIGFCAGFFGPIIFTPGANQGPLLGIFITGPLGFILGGVGGFIYWLAKRRREC